MKDEVFDKFIENIHTKEDLSVLLDQIEEAARWVYKKGKQPLSEKLVGAVPKEFQTKIATLEAAGKFPAGFEAQDTFLKRLGKYLESLPTFKLTVAFEPSEEFVATLSESLAGQIGEKVVLEILVKEEIVGGLILEYAGEYRDYSLARKLDEIIESSRPKEQISATTVRSVTK